MAEHDYYYMECKSPGHSKFYEVEIVNVPGNLNYSITTRHGRIGTKGRSMTPHSGLKIETARQTATSIVEGKKAKGYTVVRTTPTHGKTLNHTTAQTPKPAAGRFGRLMLED